MSQHPGFPPAARHRWWLLVAGTRTCVGVRCKDGIVLAVEKLLPTKMLLASSNRKIFHVDDHIGVVRVPHASGTPSATLTRHSRLLFETRL